MKRKGLVQSLVLSSVLAAGFTAVWGVAAVWMVEVGAYAVASTSSRDIVISLQAGLGFLRDGTPVVSYRDTGIKRQLRDLQGNPVAEPDSEDPFLTPTSLPAKVNVREGEEWDQRIRSFSDRLGFVGSAYWYFIVEGRRGGTGYFAGYDSESHTCIGYLGTAGLREGPLPVEERIPFEGTISREDRRLLSIQLWGSPTEHPRGRNLRRAPKGSVSGWDVYVLGADGKLYHTDLRKRTIQVAFDACPILSASLTAGNPNAIHGTPNRPAVRTKDAVVILDESGVVQKRYPIPESLRDQDISFGEANTGEAVMYSNSPEDLLAWDVEYQIFRVDTAGHCWQATITLPYLGLQRLLPWAGLVMPTPVALAGTVVALRPPSLLEINLETTYSAALGRALGEFMPALAIAQVLSAGFALFCYRRQVRYGASRMERIVWPLFVLLLGLPGWIGYRFGRSWPVLEACPDCGAVVPRDREYCLRCTSDFPRPALKGTEVFA